MKAVAGSGEMAAKCGGNGEARITARSGDALAAKTGIMAGIHGIMAKISESAGGGSGENLRRRSAWRRGGSALMAAASAALRNGGVAWHRWAPYKHHQRNENRRIIS